MNAADKPKPQFFRVGSSVVKDRAVKAMTAVDLKVYLVLALHANWTTGKCWPSYQTIRALSGCSFDCIAHAVRRLAGLGAISISKGKGQKGRRNIYTVFRTLQPSPGTHSDRTEDPRPKQKRDAKGRYHSDRTEEGCSDRTEDPHSDRTEQNEIHLNESKLIRSKENIEPPHTIPSSKTIEELLKSMGRPALEAYMSDHGYPLALIPEELTEGKA